MARKEDKINFLHAIFGLATNPIGTSQRLIKHSFPPFIFSTITCILLTIFVPIITQIYYLRLDAYKPDLFYSLIIVIFFTIVVFSIVESLILQLFSIDVKIMQMVAMIAYSFTPIMFGLWVVYFYNYAVNGSITLLTLLLTGYSRVDPSVIDLIAVVFVYFQVMAFLIFSSCVREIGQGHWTTASMITFLTAIPFYLCIVLGLAISEFAIPGTIKMVFEVAPWMDRFNEIVN